MCRRRCTLACTAIGALSAALARYASPCQDGGQALPSESAANNEFRRLPAQATSPVTSGCS